VLGPIRVDSPSNLIFVIPCSASRLARSRTGSNPLIREPGVFVPQLNVSPRTGRLSDEVREIRFSTAERSSNRIDRRFPTVIGRTGLVAVIVAPLFASFVSGCDYSSPESRSRARSRTVASSTPSVAKPTDAAAKSPSAAPKETADKSEVSERMNLLMQSALTLIEKAPQDPGGENIRIATENFNEYFRVAPIPPIQYRLPPAEGDYLGAALGTDMIKTLQSRDFTIRDARHIEDCLMYAIIARRVSGQGDSLTRVRRVFDWLIRSIQLVPGGQLGSESSPQVPARPYDVLFRGMATEDQGIWAERAWLFIALCRQLNLDAGLVAYTFRGQEERVVWTCGVLIDGKIYLFDTRIGLEIPDAKGNGVATLEEATTDPSILDRLDLPGQSFYGTTQADLAVSTIDILIDSSPGYFAPRMKQLQNRLVGRTKMILYRDATSQRDAFAAAIGKRFGKVDLWKLPINVFESQFSSADYTRSLQQTLYLFDRDLPMIKPRIDQLLGDFESSKTGYVRFRYPEHPILLKSSKKPIPSYIQEALDLTSTYFLGLCRLEENTAESRKNAKFLFRETLRLLPEPGKGRPYYYLFRSGARYNLARLLEEDGERAEAIQLYCQYDPTSQYHGNLLRARDLVWLDPTAEIGPPPPPPPAFKQSSAPPVEPEPKAARPAAGSPGSPGPAISIPGR
jgi:hypothetical protein